MHILGQRCLGVPFSLVVRKLEKLRRKVVVSDTSGYCALKLAAGNTQNNGFFEIRR